MADAITLEQLRRIADRDEAGLREDHPDGLPHGWEGEIAEYSGDTLESALFRVTLIKAFYRERFRARGTQSRAATPEDAQAAAYALLRREPVWVTLSSGREVAVTDRSLSALTEIAAHQLRIRLLDAEIDALAKLFGRLTPTWWRQRASRHRRRLMRQVADLHQRAFTAREMHRAQLYAHLFTASGAPAGPGEGPPEWWREITAEDDARIVAALIEAGPLRAMRMGERPKPKGKQGEPLEDWGYTGALVAWGVRKKVEPARVLDQGLGQAIAEMRLAAAPTLAEEVEDGD